ncbi:MAG: hypothetical protein HYU66_00800 [Armatimonadetes bacterium]|nr:hypothetical protein [Armatimonadota bacterium]
MKLALATVLYAATAFAADGLLQNSDFGQPGGWIVPAGQGWTVPDDDGHSENHCLRYVADTPQAAPPIVQEVACQPNTEYVLAAWLKSDGTLRPVVEVLAQDLQGTRIVSLTADGRPERWAPLSARFNSGATAKLMVRILAAAEHADNKPAAAGRCAADDVQVYPAAEAPADLQPTGGFMAQPPGENVALHAPYTLSAKPDYGYCTDPEDAVQLTDGAYSAGYFWVQKSTVGWNHVKPVMVDLDLGRDQPIVGASFNTAAGVAGVAWPTAIFLYVSDDRTNWYPAGELLALSSAHGVPRPEGYQVYRFWTDKLQAHGRYLTFAVFPSSAYCFCDEVEVYRGPDALLTAARTGDAVTDIKAECQKQSVAALMQYRTQATVIEVRQAIEAANLDPAAAKRLLDGLAEPAPLDPVAAGFRAVLPFNATQRRAFEARGKLWRAKGRPPVQLWQAELWDPVKIDELPPDGAKPPALEVALMRHEVRSAAFNLTVADPSPGTVEVSVAGLPGAPKPPWLTVCEVAWTATQAGGPSASALPEAAATAQGWSVSVPAGMTRQVWLNVDSADLPAATHRGSLLLQAGGKELARVPFTVQVADLTMPDKLSLGLGGWDYTDTYTYGVNAENRDKVVEFLKRYHLDTPWATGSVMPFGTHDGTGKMTQPPDTTRMDEWLARWKGARSYCVFSNLQSLHPDTAAARLRTQQWIDFWVDHLRQQGVEPSQLQLLIVDEPSAAEYDRMIVSWAKVLREAQPEVRIFEDPTYQDPRQATPELYAVSDVLCPNYPMWLSNPAAFREVFTAQQKAGKALVSYSCSGPVRQLDPYAYHRLQAWHCFAFGMEAEYFWAFGDNGGHSSWNELAAPGVCYAPQFVAEDGCVTSKHMEGVRQGMYDFEYLTMLRAKLAAATQAGRNDAVTARAAELLDKGVASVLADQGPGSISWASGKDRAIADRVRLEVLAALQALAK